MKFGEQILATLIGSFAGFVLAIILFYITEKIKNSSTKTGILKSLKREFQYNLALIDEWLNNIDKILRQITANDLQVYSYLKYSGFQLFFLQTAFQWGILYNLVENEDIGKLNNILSHCSLLTENYVMDKINLWKSRQIDQKEALSIFEFQKEKLQTFKNDLQKIMQKIKP